VGRHPDHKPHPKRLVRGDGLRGENIVCRVALADEPGKPRCGRCSGDYFHHLQGEHHWKPCFPTIKVSANPDTVKYLGDNIDVDLSGVLKGSLTMDEGARLLERELIEVCNGKQTKSDILGQVEISITRVVD